MTTLKKILPIFKSLTKNAMRPALECVVVRDGNIEATDLETSVIIKDNFGLDDGLHTVKTLGLIDGTSEGLDGFPTHRVLTEIDPVDTFTMSLDLLETLLPFTSKDETRVYLCGVAINNGHYVACDGHTLKAIELSDKVDHDYIIPNTSLSILVKLLKKYKITSDFKCLVNEDYFLVENEHFTFSSRLIQREYAKWSSVVPTKFTKKATINNWIDYKELKPLLDTRTKKSRLELKNGEVTLIIDKYENNRYIIGQCDSELNDTIGFNLEYLERASNKNKEFTLQYNNELAPVMANNSIVMPLKL